MNCGKNKKMKLILIGGAVVLPIVAPTRTVTTLSGGWMAEAKTTYGKLRG